MTSTAKWYLQQNMTVRAWTPGQHPTTLVCYITQRKQPASSLTDGTSAPTQTSPASCCNCCLMDTWFTWSWRWLAIAASPSPPETAKEAGYDASGLASHRDLSWRPFSSTSTSLTCQPPSQESMHMLTIKQSYMLMETDRQWKECWPRTWQL